jgi:hypothetical protein
VEENLGRGIILIIIFSYMVIDEKVIQEDKEYMAYHEQGVVMCTEE